jgi:hypothetical protein
MMPIGRIVSAAPDLALGLTFLLTWIAPQLLGAGKATYAAQLMMLEFVVVHSAVIVGHMGTRSTSRLVNGAWILGLSALYSSIAIVIGRASNDLWPLWSFWGLTANRLMTLVGSSGFDERRAARLGTRWVLSVGLYLFWMFLTTFAPIPELGIDASMVPDNPRVSGLWVEQPQRVLAGGVGYFFSQAYFDLKPPRWLTNPPLRSRSVYRA